MLHLMRRRDPGEGTERRACLNEELQLTCCHTASLTITRISNSHLIFFVIYQVCIYAFSQVGRLIHVGVVKHLFSSKQCT